MKPLTNIKDENSGLKNNIPELLGLKKPWYLKLYDGLKELSKNCPRETKW